MHPKDLTITDFTYDLPAEKIAKYPLKERDGSKLLVYKNENIEESIYRDLDKFIPSDTLLIFNNTKVVEARLLFQKPTGAVIEIFCLDPDDRYSDVTTAMLQKGKVYWKCLIGGASKWKHGMKLVKYVSKNDKEITLEAEIVKRLSHCFVVELSWKTEDLTFAEMLHYTGYIPLPPYLHREVEEEDKTRYQTVYAKHEGSVAAPTAGLHFTEELLQKLADKGIQKEFVTLHVGAGTFKPVKADLLKEHEMHAEFIDVGIDAIENIFKSIDKTVIAVGTTSLRIIESLYWMGLKVCINANITTDELMTTQWEPYDTTFRISAREALQCLINWMKMHNLTRLITKTQILIAPGYKLKIAKAIITNFHQPQSTLLLLIAAIVGDKWKEIYEYAMENDFRFLSYGDGCLLWKR